jgi:hypothetical protein
MAEFRDRGIRRWDVIWGQPTAHYFPVIRYLDMRARLFHGVQAGGCAIAGSLVGFTYLQLMMREVDQYTAETNVPLTNAREVQTQPLRALSIAFAAYRFPPPPPLLPQAL